MKVVMNEKEIKIVKRKIAVLGTECVEIRLGGVDMIMSASQAYKFLKDTNIPTEICSDSSGEYTIKKLNHSEIDENRLVNVRTKNSGFISSISSLIPSTVDYEEHDFDKVCEHLKDRMYVTDKIGCMNKSENSDTSCDVVPDYGSLFLAGMFITLSSLKCVSVNEDGLNELTIIRESPIENIRDIVMWALNSTDSACEKSVIENCVIPQTQMGAHITTRMKVTIPDSIWQSVSKYIDELPSGEKIPVPLSPGTDSMRYMIAGMSIVSSSENPILPKKIYCGRCTKNTVTLLLRNSGYCVSNYDDNSLCLEYVKRDDISSILAGEDSYHQFERGTISTVARYNPSKHDEVYEFSISALDTLFVNGVEI